MLMGIGQEIAQFLMVMSPQDVTDVVVLGVIGILLSAGAMAWKAVPNAQRYVEYAPGLMTSLGIFGTFVGVVIGLLHFDIRPDAIDGSIATLIEGLKTAFLTSVVGLAGAMIFNFADAVWFDRRRQANVETHTVTPSDIHNALTAQTDVLRSMQKSLAGSEEDSLVGQMKLLKADVKDFERGVQRNHDQFQTRLWTELRGFADLLAKSATEQVIEALKQVIVDFNRNLTEQFGENFKALDASVKKLVDWQTEYKDQVEQMGQQYRQSVESLVETKTAVAGIWEECKEIPLAMAELRTVLEVNQHQIQELQRHLEVFGVMRDKAVEAVPTINAKLEEIGNNLIEGSQRMQIVLLEGATDFKASVTSTNSAMNEMAHTVSNNAEGLTTLLSDASSTFTNSMSDSIARMEASSKDVHQGFMTMASEVSGHAENLRKQMSGVLNEYDTAVNKVMASFGSFGARIEGEVQRNTEAVMLQLSKVVEKGLGGVSANIDAAVERTREAINKEFAALEEGRTRELNRVMSDMGSALATITRQFADDYSGLARAMARFNSQTAETLRQ
ncbi:MAG: hypothetical protein IPG20_03425 [Gammaproteobacteria bacterium]|nr:hypothetical protein [Gammaproteobacteria bacterium]